MSEKHREVLPNYYEQYKQIAEDFKEQWQDPKTTARGVVGKFGKYTVLQKGDETSIFFGGDNPIIYEYGVIPATAWFKLSPNICVFGTETPYRPNGVHFRGSYRPKGADTPTISLHAGVLHRQGTTTNDDTELNGNMSTLIEKEIKAVQKYMEKYNGTEKSHSPVYSDERVPIEKGFFSPKPKTSEWIRYYTQYLGILGTALDFFSEIDKLVELKFGEKPAKGTVDPQIIGKVAQTIPIDLKKGVEQQERKFRQEVKLGETRDGNQRIY